MRKPLLLSAILIASFVFSFPTFALALPRAQQDSGKGVPGRAEEGQSDWQKRAKALQAQIAALDGKSDEASKRTLKGLQAQLALVQRALGALATKERVATPALEKRRDAAAIAAVIPERNTRLDQSAIQSLDGLALYELQSVQSRLAQNRKDLQAELSRFEALIAEQTAARQRIDEERALLGTRTEKQLADERAAARKRQTEIDAELSSGKLTETARANLELERRVLGIELSALAAEAAGKSLWSEVLDAESKRVAAAQALLEKERTAKLVEDLGTLDRQRARLEGLLLPSIQVGAGAATNEALRLALQKVFDVRREALRLRIERIALLERKSLDLESQKKEAERRLASSRARVKALEAGTEQARQSSTEVLAFKLRRGIQELGNELRALLEGELLRGARMAQQELVQDLEAAAEFRSTLAERLDEELRAAGQFEGRELPPAVESLRARWLSIEESKAQRWVKTSEGAYLLSLEVLQALMDRRELLLAGRKSLERRGLFVRDRRGQELWRSASLPVRLLSESGTMLDFGYGLLARCWGAASGRSSGAAGRSLHALLALLLPVLGLIAFLWISRARRRALARVENVPPGEETPRRLVHRLAVLGVSGRWVFYLALSASFWILSGADFLGYDERAFSAALARLLFFAPLWWALARVFFRPSRPQLRLFAIEDRFARQSFRLAIFGMLAWALGPLGVLCESAIPTLAREEIASRLSAISWLLLLCVLFLALVRRRLLTRVFPTPEQGGVRFLQAFILTLRPVFLLVIFGAIVAWFLGYFLLAGVLGNFVIAVIGSVVIGVVAHLGLLAEIHDRFLSGMSKLRGTDAQEDEEEEGSVGAGELLGEYLQILEFFVSVLLTLAIFSWIIGIDFADWASFLGTEAWRHEGAGGANRPVRLGDLLLCLLTFYLTFLITGRTRRTIGILLEKRSSIDRGLRYTLGTLAAYVVFLVGAVYAFGFLDLGLSDLQWMLAAAGVGIGFGLQEIISNFFSGLILLFERPLKVGDIVKTGETLGEVKKITIRSTTVTSFDNFDVIVPNKDFITQSITNWTASDRDMRSTLEVGVSYGADLKLVRDLLLETVQKHGRVYKKPGPSVFVTAFADSSINFALVYWTSLDHKRGTFSDLHYAIFAAFERAGVEIPFPQRDVILHGTEPLPLRLVGDEELREAQKLREDAERKREEAARESKERRGKLGRSKGDKEPEGGDGGMSLDDF